EEYRKIVDAKRKEINRELATIPARIDEAHKAMPDISNIDIRKIDMDIARAQVNIDECEEAKRQIAANSEDDAARCALAELQTKLACAKAGYAADNAKADEAAHEKIQKLKQEGRESADRLNALKDDLKLDLAKLDAMATLQKELADKYRAIRDENWAGSEICPTCEQSLPDDKIAASRDAFNQNKSKALEAINQRGKDECSKDMLAALDTKTKALKDEIEALSAKVLESADIVRKAQNDMPKPAPFEQTAEYIEIAQLIANLQNSTAANSDNAEKISEQDKEIRQYRLQIEEHMTKRTLFDLATRQQVRIDELSANEKRLADEYEKIEAALYLCDEFTKAKVSMLDDRINSHFKSVKFRLFETLINGGIKEGCEVVIPSPDGALVPYGFANHAGRINAGLEIIGALGEHYGIHPPVFVDNAESITEIINIKNQLIRLMVSEKDKKLRMEVSA
ncbi:MAG: hypothetical protein FWB71_06295, partial [Defluviitaleaceae bacterium]|nr:hypothetical protein [Defluviitaleaceae bacterium]